MAPLPPNQLLHIGPNPAGASWNHFNLGLGLTSHVDYGQSSLGSSPPVGEPWFYSRTNPTSGKDVVVFSAPLGGATTSSNTQYSRSELRGLGPDGTTKEAFDPTSGDHWIEGIYRIYGLSGLQKPGVCVQQMHDPSDDVIMVRTELVSGATKLQLRFNGTLVATLNASYVDGTEFYLKTRVNNGTPEVYYTTNLASIPSTPTYTSSGYFSGASTGWYMKSGCYNQTNESTDPNVDPDASIIKVEIRELKQWHTGWATPATYATTPGTGGPTVDAGADVSILPSGTFSRTAVVTLNGATLTSQQWKILSGPAGAGNILSTTASCSWTPSTGYTTSGGATQTLGVGGIAKPAPASNVELNTADRGDMNITASGTALVPRIYDGGGKKCGRITISADYIIIQNYYVQPNSQYGVYITGSHVTVQNCDISHISVSGDGDLNAITLLEGSDIKIRYNNAVNYVSGDPGGSHTDAIQTWVSSSHPTAVSNVQVIGNKFTGPSNPSRDNSVPSIHQCIMVESAGRGGNSGGSGTPSDWLVLDNTFGDSWGQSIKLDGGNNFTFARNNWIGSSDKIFDFVAGTGNVVYSSNTFGSGYGSVGASTTAGTGPADPDAGTGGSTTVSYPNGTYVLQFTAVTSAGTIADTVTVTVSTVADPGSGGGGTGGVGGTYPSTVSVGAVATSDGSGTVTVPAPVGVTTGHFQICIIQDPGTESFTSVPANWQLLDSQAITNTDFGQPGGDSSTFVFYNTTGDSASRSWSKSGTRGYQAVRMAWKDWSALGQHLTRGSSFTLTPYAPPVTPTTDKALVVTIMGSDRSDIGPSPVSVPNGWTQRFNAGATVNGNEIQWIAVAELQVDNRTTTGANVPSGTGVGTSNFTLTNADNGAMFSFVLEGVVGSGTTTGGAVSLIAQPQFSTSGAQPGRAGNVVLSVSATLLAWSMVRGAVSLIVNKTLVLDAVVFVRGTFIIFTTLSVGGGKLLQFPSIQLQAIARLWAAALPYRRPVLRTDYKYPPKNHPFRLIAQRILDGEIVEWELPVGNDFEYVEQLSGPVVMKGSFRPEIISVQELNLDGYAYWLHVEINQQIRASAILLPPQYEESAMTFSAEGVAAAPHYHIYDGVFQQIQVDPLSVVRTLWNYVQSQPQSDYGVIVSSLSSPVRIGEPATTPQYNDKTAAATAIAQRMGSGDPIEEDWTWDGAPDVVGIYNDELIVDWHNAGSPVDEQGWLEDYANGHRAADAKPYELVWWNGTNCGEEIDTLSGQTPFDYVERHEWNSDRTDVLHYFDMGYPRLGVQKPDLLFNEENILEVVPIQEDEDSYASAVLVVGAGEGADTIRGYAAQSFGDRVRKEVVITDKTITTKERAQARAYTELSIRRGRAFEISEIVINAYHTNAPIGSYRVGDDIKVAVDIPWLMETHIAWYRITSITNNPSSDKVRIAVSHAGAFDYTNEIIVISPDDYIPFEPPPLPVTSFPGNVSLSITKTLTVGATIIPASIGGITLTVSKVLTVGGIALRTGSVTLTVGKTLTAAGVATSATSSTVTLIANKSLTIGGSSAVSAAATLSIVSTLTTGGITTKLAAVSMSVSTSLTANAVSPSSFVTRAGQQLLLDGQPYRFTGMNIYNANSVNNYWYTLGTGSGLDQALTDIGPGIDAIRAWFGQWLLKPTGNTIDWAPFDHTVARVKAAGKKLIVVFADQDGTWDDGISKTLTSNWYQSGYKTVVSSTASSWGAVNTMTYKNFVLTVVDRYKAEPSILMWQLINECETKLSDGSCSTATEDAGATALRAFADDMSAAIKAADPNHLISLGTIGTGQCGTSGSRYQTIHEPTGIDLCEMHDYVANENIIGDQFNGMSVRLQQAANLNKPLFVGEMGIDPTTVGGTTARATRFQEKITAQFSVGIVGAVAWEWRNSGQTGGDPYVIPAGDPAINALRISNYPFSTSSSFSPSVTLYDFESGIQGWVGDGGPTVARVTTPTITGTGCLSGTKAVGTGFDSIRINDAGQFSGNKSAGGDTVAAKVLVPAGASNSGWNAHIEVQDATFTWIAQANVPLTRGTITQLIWTPPAGLLANCKAIGIVFEQTGGNSTQTVYVDAIQQGTMSSSAPSGAVSLTVGSSISVNAGAPVAPIGAVNLVVGKTLALGVISNRVAAVSLTVGKTLSVNGVIATNVLPVVRSSASASGASAGGSAVVPKPAGLAVGDLLIGVAVADNDGTLTALTGPWSSVASNAPVVGGRPGMKIMTKIATSTETGAANFTFTAGANVYCSAGVIAIQAGSFDPVNPLSATPVFNGSDTNATAHVAPTVSPGINNGLLVTAHSTDQGGAATNSYTPPSGMTERVDTATTDGYTGLEVNTLALTSTTATGTKTATCSNSRPFNCASFIVSPAGGGSLGLRSATPTRRDFTFTSGADSLTMGYWSNGDLTTSSSTVTDLVFVIHGDNRDADNYITYGMDAVSLAGQNNRAEVFVVAPQFIIDSDPGVSTTPSWLYWSDSGWKQGNLSQSDTYARPFRVSSFAALDTMIQTAQSSFPNLARIRIIGHSAGGQYINRYAATSSIAAGVTNLRHIVANPSSFLYLDSRRPHASGGGQPGTTTSPVFSVLTSGEITACPGYDAYKYGLASGANSYVTASTNAQIQTRYQTQRLIYLAGDQDTADVGGLDTSCEANWQGLYRFHRSANFMGYLAFFYGSAPASHTRSIVAGVGHDAQAMITSAEARSAMFG